MYISGPHPLWRRASATRLVAALLLLAGCARPAPPTPPPPDQKPIENARIRGEVHILNTAGDGPGLGPAVVYLAPREPRSADPPPPAAVHHTRDGFRPDLVAVGPAQPIRLVNDGAVQHRLFWLTDREPRELDLAAGPAAEALLDPAARGIVRFYCKLHDEEFFSVFVAPSNHFALLDGPGPFELREVPAGRWSLRIWSEPVAGGIRRFQLVPGEDSRQDIWIDSKAVRRR